MHLDLDALRRNDPLTRSTDTPFYSDLLPELQSTLAALADLAMQYEIARDTLEEWSGPEDEKRRWCAELEEAHRRAREAGLHQLARLRENANGLRRQRIES